MSNQSIIEHKANYYFLSLREDYLQIALACAYKKTVSKTKNGVNTNYKSQASPHCKALILDILEHWTNDKRSKGEGLYVFMSHPQWVNGMYHMFGRCVIIDSIDELLGEKLIEREPYKMFGRDSWQYKLNTQEINMRMHSLPDRNPHDLEPQIDPSNNSDDPSIFRRVASKNRRDASKSKPVASENRRNIDSYSETNIETNIEGDKVDGRSRDINTPPVSLSKNKINEGTKISSAAQEIVERWCAVLNGARLPLTKALIDAAESLVQLNPSIEDLKAVRLFCYTSNPGWYGKNGKTKGSVTLADIVTNWQGWQSSLQGDTRAGEKHISGFDDPDYRCEGESYISLDDPPRPTALVSEEQMEINMRRLREPDPDPQLTKLKNAVRDAERDAAGGRNYTANRILENARANLAAYEAKIAQDPAPNMPEPAQRNGTRRNDLAIVKGA